MSNSVAEAYLLIVRESLVPIVGEAVPIPFTGQIELDAWSWELKNDEQIRRNEQAEADEANKSKPGKGSSGAGTDPKKKTPPLKPDGLIRQVSEMQVRKDLSQEERNKRVKELIKKAVAQYSDDVADDDSKVDKEKKSAADGKMKLKFEKGADLATTPLLFAMSRGDLIPRAVLTLYHRSTNAPVTLAITMSNVRITSYTVDCDPEAAMSDVKEKWEATYDSVDWMYHNRPAAAGPNYVTQGTVRVFAKKPKDGKSPTRFSPI